MNQILPDSFSEPDLVEKEEIYKRSIKKLETQIEELKDEMKKKEEKYQESMKQLATENHKMREKEEKYAKSLNELEIQNRKIKELETQNGEFRDELKKNEERIKNWLEKSWTKIRESWKKSEEECKKRKTETEKILEDGKRKEKEAEDVISGLKRKIGELEDEKTWKEKFVRLKERIMIMWNDFEEAFEKDVTNFKFSPCFDQDALAHLCLRLLDSVNMLDEYFYQILLFINDKPSFIN